LSMSVPAGGEAALFLIAVTRYGRDQNRTN